MGKIISIFGTAGARPGDAVFESAYKLGRLLAEAGFGIANGGYGGTMLAAARGAAEAGGAVTGITCSAFGRGANEYISNEIRTDSLPERLQKLIDIADGYIVLPGGTGTLLELAEVWELKNKKFLDTSKPLVVMGDFWRPLTELMGTQDSNCLTHINEAQTPEEAVKFFTPTAM